MKARIKPFLAIGGIAVSVAIISGCGGGGSDSGSAPTEPPVSNSPATPVPTPAPSPSTPAPVPAPPPPTVVGLTEPEIISRSTDGGNAAPLVVIDDAGNAITIWTRESDPCFPCKNEVLARRYTPNDGWGPVETLAISSNLTIEFPALTIDKKTGKAMAVWTITGGDATNNSDLVARAFDPATGWAPPVVIDSDQAGRNREPSIDTDPNGNVMVAWTRFETIRFNLYANRYTPSGGWGAQVSIEDNDEIGLSSDSNPSLTMLSNGNALVVWNSSRGGTTNNIWGNRFNAGSGWGVNAVVESGNGATASLLRLVEAPRVLALADGKAIMAFNEQKEFASPFRYELNVMAKRFDGTNWEANSTPIGVPFSCVNCPSNTVPRIAANQAGAVVVTWIGRDPAGNEQPWASRTTNGEAWQPQTFAKPELTDFFNSKFSPTVGIDDLGNTRLVWSVTSRASGNDSLYYSNYSASSGWSAVEVFENFSLDAIRPRLAMNSKGNAMTVWLQGETNLGGVIAARYFRSGR